MKRDPNLYLDDIIESIELIEEYGKKAGREGFHTNTETQDAIIRRLEIIGEAVKNLPEETIAENPEIPWKKIAGLRDVLTHGYFGVNLDRIWKVVTDDLPNLKKDIKTIRKNLEKS